MNNPLRYTDPAGLFVDTVVDVGFVFYDINRIGADNIFGDNCPGTLLTNVTALGLDLGAIIIPGVTGLGAASRLAGKATKKGLGGNPFKGKTFQEIDKAFREKGFDIHGTDPTAGKGSYINPRTGRKYYLDKGGKYKKGTELPHVDVHRPHGSSFPKKKLPLGDKLIE